MPALAYSTRPACQKVQDIIRFVASDLPRLNTACRDGALALHEWVRQVRQAVVDIDDAVPGLDPDERLTLLQALGFIVASGERHAQALRHEPGWIVRLLPGVEPALAAAAASERVPVLTAELYWERNTGWPPLTFTGEDHELFFISAVRTQVELRAAANRQIRALLSQNWTPSTAEGARMLRAAAAAMKESHGQYLDFRRGPQGEPLMTPAQFNEMRVWLAGTRIAGRGYAGANAAYIADMVVTDYLLGTADGDYDTYVRGFAQYQSPQGRECVATDRERRPLVLVLAESLGMSAADVDRATVPQVAERVRLAPAALGWSLAAFKSLVDEFIGASGAHVGLVHVYLEKYRETMSQEEVDRMPVKPTHGTGGNSHDHTRHVHDMRRKAPRIRKLLAALKESS